MRQQSWSLAWKKGSWLRLLSGTTLPPSTADAGLESWISSLRDTRASRSVSQDDVAEAMILATSGPMPHASSESAIQLSFFSRTSPAICPLASTWSARTFREWTIGLRLAYRARLKSGLHIGESGCLSWPTATVTSDGNETENLGVSLPRLSERWPSPRTNKWGPADSHVKVPEWQTPSREQFSARRQVRQTEREPLLPKQAEQWATPTSRDHKDGADPSDAVPTNSLLGRQAPRATGPASPNGSGRPRRLNPAFVEWMMGLPPGWTDFAPVAMEWSHFVQRMRSEYLRLSWAAIGLVRCCK